MIPELGNFALTLAGVLALGAAGIGLAAPREALMQRAAISMVFGQWAFSFLAFAALTYAFVLDDFSVAYVANHSNSLLPWIYKISAVWGGARGIFPALDINHGLLDAGFLPALEPVPTKFYDSGYRCPVPAKPRLHMLCPVYQ